jgi:hypothetical protein
MNCTGHFWTAKGPVKDGDFCTHCGATRPVGGMERCFMPAAGQGGKEGVCRLAPNHDGACIAFGLTGDSDAHRA